MSKVTKHQQKIYDGLICPYCNSTTRKTTEKEVYGRMYRGRQVVVCKRYPECDSYVGCHDNGEPLGRLSNKEHRALKIQAHKAFDRLWKFGAMSRKDYYEAMSEELNIPPDYCHIGMMKASNLHRVIAWAEKEYEYLMSVISEKPKYQ